MLVAQLVFFAQEFHCNIGPAAAPLAAPPVVPEGKNYTTTTKTTMAVSEYGKLIPVQRRY